MKKTKRPLNTWAFLGIYLAILAVFAGVYALTKAINKPVPIVGTGSYTPGTYTGVGAGRNGDITVAVTVNENTIQAIQIVHHDETPGISDGAIADIPAAIVATQSLGVDSVSGATVSSEGIVAAVADAIAKAGGDVEALKNVAIAAGEHSSKELTADVVVVGGGGAGMTAAVRLAEQGKHVILFEKASFLGGAISVSGGNQVIMGSKLQAENGVTDDSVESMVADFQANGANKNNEEILTLFAENVGSATDWLVEHCGVGFAEGLHQLGEYTHNRELAYTGGGAGFAETMRKAVADSGAEVYLSTKVESLITDDNGAVVGVKAVSTDGNTDYTVSAANVILATGGYGNNKEMLTDEMKSALYYGPATSTGEGIQMAQAVGAQTANMEYGKRYPNGIEVDTGLAKSTIAGNIAGWTMSAILVNQEGSRVVNEKASNRTILETELQQTGGELFLLLDSETFEVWKSKLSEAGISESDIEKYLEANGTTPVFAHGETLEEAAAAAGIDADALKATVERYNGFVAAGVDEDFGRAEAYLTMPIGDGPYYIIEQKPRFATTMGGLVVNTSMQVLSTNGSPIAGLYAAGENCGQVMGDDSPSGANNAWAITSGKLAADAIAAK